MHRLRSIGLLCAASGLLMGSSLWAASPAEPFPADSAVGKANPAWQRLLLSSLDGGARIAAGGWQMENAAAAVAAGVPAKFGPVAMRFSAQAKGPGSKGDYAVAGAVPGQVKMLGLWVNLSADANVATVGFQISDSEGEGFICTADADWTGWKWLEADLAGDRFTPLAKPGDKAARNAAIDSPLGSVHVVWFARKAGPSAIVVDELVAVSDLGDKAPAIPVSVSDLGQATLEPGAGLHPQVVLTNRTGKDVAAEVEFLVQRDPALYSEAAPRTLYGRDVAVGTRSWFEAAGKVYHNDALTDGKLWTDFGTPYNDKEKWAESFAYVDLGRTVRVVHMEWVGGDANWMRKVDVAASADGKAYTPVEGLQGLDFYHKWGPQEIDVPQPFEARFIRLRCHIGDGERIPAFRFPAEFRVYAGVAEEAWAFPKAGPVLFQGKRTETVPARGFSAVEIGDGRALNPGAYLAAVRTKGGGVTQMNYGHIFVMPPAMDRITRDSRFGMNGVGLVELAKRQGNGWNRFENLKWPFVSPAPGVYKFDGSVNPYVKFDELFRTYHERGLFTMPYLFLTARYMVPEGAKGDGMTTPPKDLSKYGEFVFQSVARYGSKKHPAGELLTEDKVSGLGYLDTFELWNEADLNDPNWGSWRGVFTDYYVMYRFGAEAVKRADPDATVANGGWSGMDVPLMETMRNYKYPDGKCPLDFTDLLSVHYYSFRVAPELATINDNTVRDGVPPQDQQTFEHSLAALVAWRDTHKPSMPIWISETGYDSGGPRGVDERLQACWLPRDVMMILASGIDKVQVFREKGSGGGLFESSGVIRNDESLKPSWFTYATLIRQLDGVTQRPAKVPFEDGNIRMYLWKRGDNAIVTAWAIAGAARLDVALGRCTVTDAFGASRTMDVPRPLELTEFPLYLTDFADPAVVKHLQEQARTMAEKERRRIERLSKAQTYLFDFGSMDRVGTRTLAPGVVRPFTPVVAADRYGESEDYGFETKVVADKVEAWRRNPLTEDEVILEGAARFTFNARPGDYVLQIYARPDKDNQVFIRGIEGGDVALKVPSGGEIVTATVKVGAKPVTLETGTGFYGALCWISMVPVDRPEP